MVENWIPNIKFHTLTNCRCNFKVKLLEIIYLEAKSLPPKTVFCMQFKFGFWIRNHLLKFQSWRVKTSNGFYFGDVLVKLINNFNSIVWQVSIGVIDRVLVVLWTLIGVWFSLRDRISINQFTTLLWSFRFVVLANDLSNIFCIYLSQTSTWVLPL